MTSGPHPAAAAPFGNSRRKLVRAKEHLSNLEGETGCFLAERPYRVVIEPDPEEPKHLVYKFKLNKPLPDSLANLTNEVVFHLRTALDNAVFGLAVSAGVENPRCAAFPFSGSAGELDKAIKGRCKDVPEEIYPLFRAYQPYRGGNDLLWALNEVSNTDKHALLAIAVATELGDVDMLGGALVGGLPINPTWDSRKQEIKLATFLAGHTPQGYMNYTPFIAFNEIPVVGGEPVSGVLNQFVSMVEGILTGLEAEARRLGLFR